MSCVCMTHTNMLYIMFKRKLIFICLTLVMILIMPSITAFSMNSNSNDCCFLGTIKGGVAWQTGGYSGAVIPFASIEIEGVRKKYCSIIGTYLFTGLQFDRTYKIIADAHGYESDSTTVILTEDGPIEEVYFYLKKNDEEDVKTFDITTKNFVGDNIFIIFGTISNPRVVEAGSNQLLVFFAEKVFVIGFTYGYFGPTSITQFIFSEEVKLGWKTSGPDFRGSVTDNFILGRQTYKNLI